jgi:hypothetical protein
MTRTTWSLVAVLGLTVLVVSHVAFADSAKKAADPAKDSVNACTEMMQGAGVTEEGKKAMRDFMRSDKAPETMSNMMEMARKMGNGDPMLGMTKMMEMMGGGGGMMGGQASPRPHQPK